MKPTLFHPSTLPDLPARPVLDVVVANESPFVRALLARLIENTGQARVVASCGTGPEAIARIVALRPDIAFLDVQMSGAGAFALLRTLGDQAPRAVVFVTSLEQSAVCLLEAHGAVYVLRPLGAMQFHRAFNRALRRARSGGDLDMRARRALLAADLEVQRVPAGVHRREHVAIRVGPAVSLIRTADVDWWESSANYLRLHMGGMSHRLRSTAVALEQQLDPAVFVRIHRRYIVNVERVVQVRPEWRRDGVVVLRDGTDLRLSRNYSAEFLRRVEAREAPQSVFASSDA